MRADRGRNREGLWRGSVERESLLPVACSGEAQDLADALLGHARLRARL